MSNIEQVKDIDPRIQYVASAGQTEFVYPFPIFSEGDLAVQQNGSLLTLGTDYTVSGVADEDGGIVTLTSGATAGDIMTIYRDMALERLIDYQQNGDFLADNVNRDFDRIWLAVQQLQGGAGGGVGLGRAWRASAGDSLTGQELIIADEPTRSGRFVGFDSNGKFTYSSPSISSDPSQIYSDVLTMQNDSDLTVGVFVRTVGYSTPGDGGGNDYEIVAAGTGAADGGSFIDLPSSGLQARGLFPSGAVCLEQFGVGGVDDLIPINAALAFSKSVVSARNTVRTVSSMPSFDGHVIRGILSLSISEGEKNLSGTASIFWADNLVLNGASVDTLDFSSLGAISGSAGDWSVPINVTSEGSAQVGMFLRISGASGTGAHNLFEGVWEITNVAAGEITVRNTARNASFPTHTLTDANIFLIKTVIITQAENVIHQYAGTVTSDRIVYKIENATALDGTKAYALAPRANASENVFENGTVSFGSNTGFTGAGNHGFVVGGTGWAELAPGVSSCGNNQDGFHATEGASMFCKFTVANGNGESGIMTEMNADAEADGIHCLGNAEHGAESISGKMGLAQATTVLSYNLLRGIQAQDGAVIRAAQSVCAHNQVGMRAEEASVILAPNSTVDNNTNEGYFATRGSSYIDASGGTLTNNGTGARADRKADINLTGSITVSGNGTDFSSMDGLIEFTGAEYYPAGSVNWADFPSPPVFNGVTDPTYTTQNGKFHRLDEVVFWKITLTYSGLDTADTSVVSIGPLPVTSNGRNGGVQLRIVSSDGISMAATETYQANYSAATDNVVLIDSSGSLMTYNGGQISSSGTIEISGWYEVIWQ